MKNYESNCGGKRRGCCIIMPDVDSDSVSVPFAVFGLPSGRYAVVPMVFKANPKATRKHRKASR